jgi:hypothetical protein
MVWMYYLIRGIVGGERFTEIERMVMFDTQTQFIPKTQFERENYSRGKAESTIAVLEARSFVVTEDQRSKLLACTDAAKLGRLITRAVSAASVAELLADL